MMFGTKEKFDLQRIPFAREDSYIVIHDEYPGHQLHFTFSRVSPWFCLERRLLTQLFPLESGKPVPYEYHATPAVLTIETANGSIELCIAEKELLRIRAHGAGLRFETKDVRRDEGVCPVFGNCLDANFGLFGKLLFVPLCGSVTGSDGEAITITLLPDENGDMEFAVHTPLHDLLPRESYEAFDAAAQKVQDAFESFCARYPAVPEEFSETARYALYNIWSYRMGTGDQALVQQTMVAMSRIWLSHAFAWQQSYHAMAIRSDKKEAWRLIKSMFDYQLDSGMLPDWVDYYSVNYLACKPGIQGFAFMFLLENAGLSEVLTKEECEKAYEPFCRWANFWLQHRASDREGVVRYFHADESGWDEATIFARGLPVEAPDLLAFVIYITETCSHLAEGCGKQEEAARWMAISKTMLNKLITEFWNGKQFIARLPRTGEIVESRSIACYQPIILGKRLPQDIIDAIAEAVMDESEFFTDIGLTGESMRSPECQFSYLFMKGRVVAPVQMLMSVGLYTAGKTEAAKKIAYNFCAKLREEGMLLGFAPMEYEPATGKKVENHPFPTPTDPWPWSAWAAGNFMIMASFILNDGKEAH